MRNVVTVDEALLDALAANICRNCALPIKVHVDNKCPFEASDFVQVTREELCAYTDKFWDMIPIQGLHK